MVAERTIVDLPGLRSMTRAAVHEVPFPGGGAGQWESIYSGTQDANVAAFTPDGKLILVEMHRWPVGTRIRELPGGALKPDLSRAESARQGLLRETGYSTPDSLEELSTGFLYTGRADTGFTVFFARNCTRTQQPALNDMEVASGLITIERHPNEIAINIALGSYNCHLLLSNALLVLHMRGEITLDQIR